MSDTLYPAASALATVSFLRGHHLQTGGHNIFSLKLLIILEGGGLRCFVKALGIQTAQAVKAGMGAEARALGWVPHQGFQGGVQLPTRRVCKEGEF